MKTRRGIVKDKKGFTGLEAAIVLTAFIVVAAVFSYMVLGAGFFSTEKAKSVIHTGVEKATSSAEVAGDVIGHGWNYNYVNDTGEWNMSTSPTGDYESYYAWANSTATQHLTNTTYLTVVEFQIQLTAGETPLDMDKVVLSYSDSATYVAELAASGRTNASSGNLTISSWNYNLASTIEMGKVNMLDPNEKMSVIVGLPDYGVIANKPFKIDFKPAMGGTITLSKTAPGAISKTMVIY